MNFLLPDIGYFAWAILGLVNLILLVISLFMIFNSRKLSSNLKLALVIISVFVVFIGPVISIILVKRQTRHSLQQHVTL